MNVRVKAPLSWQSLDEKAPVSAHDFIVRLVATVAHVKLKGGHKAASKTAPHCMHTPLLSFPFVGGGGNVFLQLLPGLQRMLRAPTMPLWRRR